MAHGVWQTVNKFANWLTDFSIVFQAGIKSQIVGEIKRQIFRQMLFASIFFLAKQSFVKSNGLFQTWHMVLHHFHFVAFGKIGTHEPVYALQEFANCMTLTTL